MSRGIDWDKVRRQRRVEQNGRYDPVAAFVPSRPKRGRKRRRGKVPAWRREWYGRNVPFTSAAPR